MSEVISIDISSQELAQRADRMARARHFQPVDFVPVQPNLYVRYWLPKVGGSFAEYFQDPEAMLRGQILGQKWVLENVPSDLEFGSVSVDFQNVREAGTFGCEIAFPSEDLLWAGEGWVRTDADLETLRRIDPLTEGLSGRTVEFAQRMEALADRYVVRLRDGVEFRPAAKVELPTATMGPFTVAGQVAGIAEVFAALYERPDWLGKLLDILTEKIVAWMQLCERVQGMETLVVADDFAGNLSAEHFRQFVAPRLQRIRSAFPHAFWNFHLCGKVDHLIPILADELRIDEFGLFGYQVDRRRTQEVMGGRVVLTGNVAPMNLYAGTPESVLEESLEALRVFGRGQGGFILADGANIAPDSPVENIAAMWKASRLFASEPPAG